MKNLQHELEEARAEVSMWMERIRSATTARNMMGFFQELAEAQIYLESLEWIQEDYIEE